MVKFDSSRRDKLEETILVMVNEALAKLEIRSEGEAGVDPNHTLHHCLGNVMNALIFGKVYDEDDEQWKWMQYIQEESLQYIGVSGPINFLPFLRFIPHYGNIIKLLITGLKKSHGIYRNILEQHRKNLTEPNNFLVVYDEEIKRREKDGEEVSYFTETQLFYLAADLYGAGVDTTLTTLRWFLYFMAAYPEEQVQIQQEMDNIVGEHMPTLKDRPLLPRLEAAIMEVQRIRSVVPVGIPHGTTEDTQIEDYDIPKGSMIIPLQWAIHMNPSYWLNPRDFMPGRFLAEDGGLIKPDAFLPFQCGNRMCPGDELARMILFLFCAQILRRFSLQAPTDQPINLEGDCGITLTPKPQRIIFMRRH